jgi:hypothetical protein
MMLVVFLDHSFLGQPILRIQFGRFFHKNITTRTDAHKPTATQAIVHMIIKLYIKNVMVATNVATTSSISASFLAFSLSLFRPKKICFGLPALGSGLPSSNPSCPPAFLNVFTREPSITESHDDTSSISSGVKPLTFVELTFIPP